MEIKLEKRPQNVILIEGFPGLGLVGAITAEFLINHLNAEKIGSFSSSKIPPIVGIHKGNVVEPFSIFYDKKNNIVIVRALSLVAGIENELSDAVIKLSKMLKAKEVIDLEGVESKSIKSSKSGAFYFTTDEKKGKKFDKLGIKKMDEGIVYGVAASLISKAKGTSFIFAETHSELPDSRAAAKIIEVLDNYLGLKVDYKPLIKKAELFESKLKELIAKSMQIHKEKTKETYLG